MGDFDTLYWNVINYFKYRNKLVMDKYIIQTSDKKELMSKDIKIKNFIMMKRIDSFVDYRDEYFSRYKAKKNILMEMFYDMFSDYLVEDSYYSIRHQGYDIVINDFNRDIYLKEIIKDLTIIEFDSKQCLVYFGNSDSVDMKELEHYIIDEKPKFIVFSFDLLFTFQIDELQTYFTLQYKKTNSKKLLDRIINLFKVERKSMMFNEEESFTALFSKNNITNLQFYDFEKYIYFNNDFKIKQDDIINMASVGVTGGGKTYTLNMILLQILFGGKFKRIIYFDTQNSFERTIMHNVVPMYQNRVKSLQDYYFKVDEENFYLSEVDFVNAVNFLMESRGYTGSADKSRLLNGVDYDDPETFKDIVSSILEEQQKKLSVFKELEKLEDIDMIKNFLHKIKVKKTSIFDDLEANPKFFCILSFKDSFFYEVCTYLYLQKLKTLLYIPDEDKTYLFADETQKYLQSQFLKKILLDLVKEKRQYGFRFMYTGLSYNDISSFVQLTQHIIFNSFNDPYMKNNLINMTSKPIDTLKTPIEKVVNNTSNSTADKVSLNLPFLRSVGKKSDSDEKQPALSSRNALFESSHEVKTDNQEKNQEEKHQQE